MSVTVVVTKKQGSTMGTVIAKVTDPGANVRDVNFYIAVPNRSPELGPYPPDVVRRPAPGVYEKDVVLDPEFETRVRIEVITDPQTAVSIEGGAVQVFAARTAPAGGTGEVRVQDADTPAAVAGTLAFQGTVLSVVNGVATFDLDGRYARANASNQYGGYVQYADVWHSSGQGGFTVHGRDGTAGWHLYSVGNNLHFHAYSPGFSSGVLSSAGDLSLAGSVYAGGGFFHGAGNARVHIGETSAQFVTAAGAALQARVGSLLVSDSYADAPSVPANGIRARGNITSGGVVRALSGTFSGAGGAYCYLDNSYVGWFTSGTQALGARAGSMLVSASYADSAHVPANGIYTPNTARLGTLQGTAATQTGYDTLFLGSGAGANFFLDRNVAGGQLIVGFNTPKSTAGQQATFQIFSNATDRQTLFAATGAGATGGESWVSMPRGAALGAIRIASADDGHTATIRRTDGGDIWLQAGVAGRVNIGDPSNSTAYKLNVNGDVYVQGGWLRTNGSTGWYNQSHGIGIHAQDGTYVRTYGTQYFRTGWFTCDAGGGLYSPDHGTHIIAESGSCFRVNTGSGLRFTDKDAAQQGYVYHDAGGFGLLHRGGGWAVRTWNGGAMLYGDVQVETHLNLTDGNWNHLGTGKRIYFGSSPSDGYAIFKSASWPSPGGGYSRLVINYHTGIVMGAQQAYGGIQFFGTELGGGGAKLFSIGEGDGHVRVANTLYAGGKVSSAAGYTAGGYLWLDSTAHGSTVHGTQEYIHMRSIYGVIVQDQAGATQGYLHYGGGSFGLLHAGGGWAVRTWNGGVELRGRAQDDLGNPYATSLSGTANPTMGAREGTLYIQY